MEGRMKSLKERKPKEAQPRSAISSTSFAQIALRHPPEPLLRFSLESNIMEAVKRFFSSPRFAVAGASTDTNKFGYKRARE